MSELSSNNPVLQQKLFETLEKQNAEIAAAKTELTAQKQQLMASERAKLVEAYNVCKEAFDQIALSGKPWFIQREER